MFSGTLWARPWYLSRRQSSSHSTRLHLTCAVLLVMTLLGCGPATPVPGSQPASASPAAASAQAAPSTASTPSTTPATSASVLAAVFPVTITDDTGRQVTIEAAPKRIVSAAPSNTEILYALGLADRIAAVTTFCDYPAPAKDKPKIGGLRPSLEVIVAHEPDLVLGIRGTPAEVVGALEEYGVPVVILNPPNVDGVLANIHLVGRLTGATGPAEQLTTQMRQRWNAIAEQAKTAPSRPRVFYEIASSPTGVTAAGPGTFIDAMITAAGGENVLAALTPGEQYPKVNTEVIVQADPEIIILGNAVYGQSAATVAARAGWGALTAVERGAIVSIADPNVTSRPGPRLVEGLELIARAIHPQLFGPSTPKAP